MPLKSYLQASMKFSSVVLFWWESKALPSALWKSFWLFLSKVPHKPLVLLKSLLGALTVKLIPQSLRSARTKAPEWNKIWKNREIWWMETFLWMHLFSTWIYVFREFIWLQSLSVTLVIIKNKKQYPPTK